jgi:hypothetical protein
MQRRFSRTAVVALVFGLLNASNWLYGLSRGGCTGHEIPMLLNLLIPGLAGFISGEAPWSIAVVMTLPAWMTPHPFAWGWRQRVFNDGMIYLICAIPVLTGWIIRNEIWNPLSTRWARRAAAGR